jgi:HK97 gp10 family phage protein
MADHITVKVTGLRETQQALRDLGKVPSGPVGKAAVRGGAEVIAGKMRGNIVAQGLVATGALLRSIDVFDRVNAPGADPAAGAGSLLRYAHFSEYGTSRQPARPWARPAEDEGRAQAEAVMGKVLQAGIEAEAKRRIPPAPTGG